MKLECGVILNQNPQYNTKVKQPPSKMKQALLH